MGGGFQIASLLFSGLNPNLLSVPRKKVGSMKSLTFVVKVNHHDSRGPEYVRRIDRIPVQMTSNRKMALVMGRFTAEDVVQSLHTSHRGSGSVSVTAVPDGRA